MGFEPNGAMFDRLLAISASIVDFDILAAILPAKHLLLVDF